MRPYRLLFAALLSGALMTIAGCPSPDEPAERPPAEPYPEPPQPDPRPTPDGDPEPRPVPERRPGSGAG